MMFSVNTMHTELCCMQSCIQGLLMQLIDHPSLMEFFVLLQLTPASLFAGPTVNNGFAAATKFVPGN